MRMNKLLVEYLGTCFLMFIILYSGKWYSIGAALAVALFLGGGGSFNPAVTLALVYANKLAKSQAVPYIVAEIAGALSAALLIKFV